MNGIWNRSPTIIYRLSSHSILALLVGGMGGGDENLTGGLPPEKTLLSASLIELNADQIFPLNMGREGSF